MATRAGKVLLVSAIWITGDILTSIYGNVGMSGEQSVTSREYGAPQENTNVVLDMATEILYGAARILHQILYFQF